MEERSRYQGLKQDVSRNRMDVTYDSLQRSHILHHGNRYTETKGKQ